MKNHLLRRQTHTRSSAGRIRKVYTAKGQRVAALCMAFLVTLPLLSVAVLPVMASSEPNAATDRISAYTATANDTWAETEIQPTVTAEDALAEQAEQLDATLAEEASVLPLNELESQSPAIQAGARILDGMTALSSRSVAKIYYPYPSGAMAVSLYLDGKRVLQGQVADIGGTVYVPVQRFADMFGSFKTTYQQATEQVAITGANLSVTVKVGDPYITVNERIFYTGSKVLSLGGWIFVPITSMTKAMGAEVYIKKGYYEAYITSGNPAGVAWASSYYDSTDLYWLSRIISAEAKGEPLAGQIAVGNVVLNRVRSSAFPNTVKGVIFDNKYGTQFSPTANGTIYNTPTSSAVMAAKICLEGYSLSTQALYFYNPSIATSSWISRTRPYIMTIGNHKFYG